MSASDGDEFNTLRLMSFNTYLVPSLFADKHSATAKGTFGRAQRIGEFIVQQQCDVVMCQEVWGAHTHCIEEHTHGAYLTLPGYSSWGYSMLDIPWGYVTGKGGLWGAQLNSSAWRLSKFWKHQFTVSNTRSGKGVFAGLFAVDDIILQQNGWSWKHVLQFNTHLDPTNKNNSQVKQLREIAEFMTTVVEELAKSSGADFDNTAVLICGDFNIEANSDLNSVLTGRHERQAKLGLEIRDLHAEYVRRRAGSRGPEATYAEENSLTHEADQRIDYILAVDKLGDHSFLPVEARHFEVFKQPKGEELSDHWPIVADIAPRK